MLLNALHIRQCKRQYPYCIYICPDLSSEKRSMQLTTLGVDVVVTPCSQMLDKRARLTSVHRPGCWSIPLLLIVRDRKVDHTVSAQERECSDRTDNPAALLLVIRLLGEVYNTQMHCYILFFPLYTFCYEFDVLAVCTAYNSTRYRSVTPSAIRARW